MPASTEKTILVIDDDTDLQNLLKLKLEQKGFHVITADNGDAGLKKLEECEPDMVMVDVQMPIMDGFEFCVRATRYLQTRHFPIMIMTATDDDASVNRAYQCGATDFVTKPINQAKLIHRIRFALKASATAERLSEREKLLLSAQKTAKMGEWTYDIDKDEFYCSPEAAVLFGLEPRPCHDYKALLVLISDNNLERVRSIFQDATFKDKDYSVEFEIKTSTGQTRRIRQTVDFEQGTHHRQRLLGVFQDMTVLREAEQKIHALSMYDSLTGLPNREFFQRQLAKSIAIAHRNNRCFALIKLNIDNFMRINANLGHAAGDDVLNEVSKRFANCVRESNMRFSDFQNNSADDILLGHLGADNFAMVLNNIDHYEESAEVVKKLFDSLNNNLVINDESVHLSTSIGISFYPDDAATADDLIMKASQALTHAKEIGPNKHSYSYYSLEFNKKAYERLQTENLLAKALVNDEFIIHFQPKINLENNTISGAEVLLRWHNPELGIVSPAEFVPMAENTGLMDDITEWVINQACAQLRLWQEQDFFLPSLAINLEPSALLQEDFRQRLLRKLRDEEIDLGQLEFEITESTLMDNIGVVLPVLEEINKMGSSISIDDFGTGYSSLGYLKSLPISTLKIDKSFMQELDKSPDDAVIVNAVISLAHNLGLKVIAEGVENSAQLEFLRERNCDVVQGYYYSAPLSAKEFLQWCLEYEKSIKSASKSVTTAESASIH
ncbi:MAG: EAL domain-containing protein [Gammaproteobacteria bacterium]